jgi:hypothetical protein
VSRLKNEWSYTSTPQYAFMVWCSVKNHRGKFTFKREEVAGGWRRLHNKELHNLYASTNIIRVIKSRIIWARHVARMS